MPDWKKNIRKEILSRGRMYYSSGSVLSLNKDGKTYTADVEGGDIYKVRLYIENGRVINPSCTCPYADDHMYCKHIVAALYEIEAVYGEETFEESEKKDRKYPFEAEIDYVTLTFGDDGGYHYLNFGSSLEKYKPSRKNYEEALKMFESGAVKATKARISTDQYSSQKALVYEVTIDDTLRDETAIVTLTLGRNGIVSTSCTSLSYRSYYCSLITKECGIYAPDRNGIHELCVHKTIGLLSLFSFLSENRDIIDFSDREALDFINNFRKQTKKRTDGSRGEYTVDIEPTLGEDLSLSLKISGPSGRYYKVRDLAKLTNAVTVKDIYPLTKDVNIDFSSSPLSERAEKIMKVLQLWQIRNVSQRYYRSYSSDKSTADMTGVLDEFYSTMKDSCVYDRSGHTLSFAEAKPSFRMTVDDLTENGRRLGVRVHGTVTQGDETSRYIYWVDGSALYRADKDAIGAASQLLNIADERGRFSFTVGMGLIDRFYQNILPELSKAGEITDNAREKLSGILKEPPSCAFYIDVINDCTVLSAVFRYDSKEITLYPSSASFAYFRSQLCTEYQKEISSFLDSLMGREYTDNGSWVLSDTDDAIYSFYHGGLEALKEKGEVFVTDAVQVADIRKLPSLSSSIDIDEKNDGILNFSVELEDFSIEELVAILRSYKDRKKFHRLKDGAFITLEDETLDTLCDLFLSSGLSIKDFTDGKMQLPLYRALYLDQMLKEQNGMSYDSGQRFRRLIKEFKTINESDYDVPSCLDTTMRSYQKDGYRWMRVLIDHGFGGILADDMGLGKTLQTLALLLSMKEEGKKGTSLIVSPASLVFNWKAEGERFTPALHAGVVSGTLGERKAVLEKYKDYDVLITSYDLLKRDISLYDGMHFEIMIIDEAQFIKNHNTAMAKAVRVVDSTHRLALTGTPVENRLSELWSIFEFLMPGFLFSQETFRKNISGPIEKNGDRKAAERLRKLTRPFILRRLKGDVLKDLPEKIEETRVTPLVGEQLKLYTAEVAKAKGMLKGKGKYEEKKIEILAELMRIREICCDPSLVFSSYNGESAKREAVMDLIVSAIDGGHRILLFSQFTSMLSLIENDLNEREIEYCKITGDTGKAKRLELVNAFNSGTTPVFLISLKAGGTGLNLTGADIVIHYDPWWNTAVENQATDRAHRIGQTKKVTVYKMIAQNTIEEKIVKLQESKKDLASSVVSAENISLSSLSKDELMELLSISQMT